MTVVDECLFLLVESNEMIPQLGFALKLRAFSFALYNTYLLLVQSMRPDTFEEIAEARY